MAAGDDDAVDIRPLEAAVCTVAVVGGCGRDGVLESEHLQRLLVEGTQFNGVDRCRKGESFQPFLVTADKSHGPYGTNGWGNCQVGQGAVAEGTCVYDFDGIAPSDIREGVAHEEGCVGHDA